MTSTRERRLWLWTLAVMVAIYSTLGPAQLIAAELRSRNLLSLSLGVVLVVLATPFAVRWVRTRPRWREIGVVLGVAGAYVMGVLRVLSPEERTHLFEYGIVAVLLHQAFIERTKNGRRVRAPAVLAVVVTAILGLIDESIQALLPNRVYDLRDVGFNALAGLMAIGAKLAAARARRWDRFGRRRR